MCSTPDIEAYDLTSTLINVQAIAITMLKLNIIFMFFLLYLLAFCVCSKKLSITAYVSGTWLLHETLRYSTLYILFVFVVCLCDVLLMRSEIRNYVSIESIGAFMRLNTVNVLLWHHMISVYYASNGHDCSCACFMGCAASQCTAFFLSHTTCCSMASSRSWFIFGSVFVDSIGIFFKA